MCALHSFCGRSNSDTGSCGFSGFRDPGPGNDLPPSVIVWPTTRKVRQVIIRYEVLMSKKIVIIGAGPGGLTAGMILARHGYDVEIFEKEGEVGGRNAALRLGDYTFDTGPTFLMMNFILEEVFELAGRDVAAYLQQVRLDPCTGWHSRISRCFPPAIAGRWSRNSPGCFPAARQATGNSWKRSSAATRLWNRA